MNLIYIYDYDDNNEFENGVVGGSVISEKTQFGMIGGRMKCFLRRKDGSWTAQKIRLELSY